MENVNVIDNFENILSEEPKPMHNIEDSKDELEESGKGEPTSINVIIAIEDKTTVNNSQSLTNSPCTACGLSIEYQVNKRRKDSTVLSCHKCNGYVHFGCTNLPPYMLYSLSQTAKRYACEACVDTPALFIEEINNNNNVDEPYNTSEEKRKSTSKCDNNKYNHCEFLEQQIKNATVLFEKYDFQGIAENLLTLGSQMEKVNGKMGENIGMLKEVNLKPEQITPHDAAPSEELKMNAENAKKESESYRHSYELMVENVNEYEKKTKRLSESNERHLQNLNEKNRIITDLEIQNNKLIHINNANTEQMSKLEYSEQKIDSLNAKYTEIFGKCEAHHLENEILNQQLIELRNTNERLNENLTFALRDGKQDAPRDETIPNAEAANNNNTRVVILHDSLCGKINNTLLSRENVISEKIWAPNLVEMKNKIEGIQNTETIVIQALTRDVGSKSVEEMNNGIQDVVDIALTKAENVVISTITARDDNKEAKVKAELVNANIKYTYMGNEKIFICDNNNLNDKKFRREDGIHLTPHGTAVLATNLKYKIAETLKIKVIKKERKDYERRNYDGYTYNNSHW